ncbi:MAG: hypothetical protein KatS3mg087_1381 [Patescibacteria group bacterium]|nr:MAG: hypothetical protein KatS3mg087_1381 [Patescibacteria group bacterium]
MNEYTIQLTEEQLASLVKCIDAGVRSGGLQVAKPAINVLDIIDEQVQKQQEKQGLGKETSSQGKKKQELVKVST